MPIGETESALFVMPDSHSINPRECCRGRINNPRAQIPAPIIGLFHKDVTSRGSYDLAVPVDGIRFVFAIKSPCSRVAVVGESAPRLEFPAPIPRAMPRIRSRSVLEEDALLDSFLSLRESARLTRPSKPFDRL